MDFRDTINRINDLTFQVTDKLGFIAPLATRIVIGLAFYQAGSGKFRHFENVVGFFQGIEVPFPAFNAGLVASMRCFARCSASSRGGPAQRARPPSKQIVILV